MRAWPCRLLLVRRAYIGSPSSRHDTANAPARLKVRRMSDERGVRVLETSRTTAHDGEQGGTERRWHHPTKGGNNGQGSLCGRQCPHPYGASPSADGTDAPARSISGGEPSGNEAVRSRRACRRGYHRGDCL